MAVADGLSHEAKVALAAALGEHSPLAVADGLSHETEVAITAAPDQHWISQRVFCATLTSHSQPWTSISLHSLRRVRERIKVSSPWTSGSSHSHCRYSRKDRSQLALDGRWHTQPLSIFEKGSKSACPGRVVAHAAILDVEHCRHVLTFVRSKSQSPFLCVALIVWQVRERGCTVWQSQPNTSLLFHVGALTSKRQCPHFHTSVPSLLHVGALTSTRRCPHLYTLRPYIKRRSLRSGKDARH